MKNKKTCSEQRERGERVIAYQIVILLYEFQGGKMSHQRSTVHEKQWRGEPIPFFFVCVCVCIYVWVCMGKRERERERERELMLCAWNEFFFCGCGYQCKNWNPGRSFSNLLRAPILTISLNIINCLKKKNKQ